VEDGEAALEWRVLAFIENDSDRTHYGRWGDRWKRRRQLCRSPTQTLPTRASKRRRYCRHHRRRRGASDEVKHPIGRHDVETWRSCTAVCACSNVVSELGEGHPLHAL